MIVLALGDVVGSAGCDYIRANLGRIKARYGADITIANGENSAKGNGVTPKSAQHLLDSGVDVITTGNHALRRREIYDTFDSMECLIRPANYHPTAPGRGMYIYDAPAFRLCVVNLQGLVYLHSLQSPFDCVDELLKKLDTPNIIVDFHAEATAEKLCLGYYLDGQVSAVLGTHTHVPTADARILPGGTGYISDLGMCGGRQSVLGVRAELALRRMRTGLPVRFEEEPEDVGLCGAVLDIDEKSGKCRSIESLVMV